MDSLDFETQLVSSMMIKGDHPDVREVMGKIPAEAFYDGRMREIYVAVCSLINQCEPTDPFTVKDCVSDATKDIVVTVSSRCVSASNIKAWAKRVRQCWMLRKAKDRMSEAMSILELANVKNINEAISQAASLLSGIEMESNDKLPRRLSEIIPDWVDVLERRLEGKKSGLYLEVGIEPIDQKYGGFDRTDLIVIAGSPGMGKTELAVFISNNIGKKKGVGLFFSLEMSDTQMVERHIGDRSTLSITKLRNPLEMTDEDHARMNMAVSELLDQNNYVMTGSFSVDEIISHAVRMATGDEGLSFLSIDYLQLVKKMKAERNDIAIGDITRKLKLFALEYKVPVILLSQLNRSSAVRQDKRPVIQDLKESSSIEQDADVIIFPFREEVVNKESRMKGIAEIIVAKYRSGEPFTPYMGWRNGHFVNIDQEEVARMVAENERRGEGKKEKSSGWM